MKIEKGFPIPGRQRGRSGPRPFKYPWDQMEPGDSFFLSGAGLREQKAAYCAGHSWCLRWHPEWNVSTRQVDGGVRVWMEWREPVDPPCDICGEPCGNPEGRHYECQCLVHTPGVPGYDMDGP